MKLKQPKAFERGYMAVFNFLTVRDGIILIRKVSVLSATSKRIPYFHVEIMQTTLFQVHQYHELLDIPVAYQDKYLYS